MALDWRDIKTSNIEILKLQDSDGRLVAVAKASSTQYYGCSWHSYEQNGDLSCGSRYYDECDLFPTEEEIAEDSPVMRSEDSIELDIRRLIVNLQMNACMGTKISGLVETLDMLRLEMKARIQADFEAELNAD